ALPPPGQGADVRAGLSMPDLGLEGRTRFDLTVGRATPDGRRRLDVNGVFNLHYAAMPSAVPLHPRIEGTVTATGTTSPAAVGATVADPVEALTTFRGTLTYNGTLTGVPGVFGRFRLSQDLQGGDRPSAVDFRARVGVFGDSVLLPHVDLTGSGTSSGDSLSLSGRFSGYGPGIAWGTWSFSRSGGFELSGNYVGLQFGPLGLKGIDPHRSVPTSPTDPVPLDAFEPREGAGGLSGMGTISMFNPGPSVGYTRIWGNLTRGTYLSFAAGWAPTATVEHNDMMRPDAAGISPFSLPGIGDVLQDALRYHPSTSTSVGSYVGASLQGTF
ncbi:MAG: hypothetical protein WCL00_10430, partial [Bacteroidota bacterium]